MIRALDGKRLSTSLRLLLALLVTFAIALPTMVVFGADQANAQEVRERRSIIDLLFRGGRPSKQIKRPRAAQQKKKRKAKTATARNDSSMVNIETVVQKLPDAKKILVIGDFMASALADGLTMAVENDAGIVVAKGADGSSGLVRTDHLDWPSTLQTRIGELKPALIVIMLGANDRQQMTVAGTKEKFRSDAWNAEYEQRVAALIAVITDQKLPFIWTGLPAFQSPSLSADAATFNSFYRGKVEKAGGTFVDIWDGFADENGKFIASGSDVNGQPVRLRGSDGLSLTKAGKRKMAFYLEKDLRRLLGADALPGLAQLDASALPLDDAEKPPAIANITSMPPISFSDPELDGSSALLGSNLLPKTTGLTPRDLLIVKGETVEAPEGRIDDYSWKAAAKPAN